MRKAYRLGKILTEDELKEILDPIAMTMPGIAAEYLIKQKQQAYIEKNKLEDKEQK